MSKVFPVKNTILARYIQHISYTEFHSSGDDFILVVPDGMTELVINLGGAYERKYKNEPTARKIISSHLIGLKTEACFVKPNREMRSITVRFKPGAIKNFTKVPMAELVNQLLEGTSVFGKDLSLLEDKILNSKECSEINILIEEYLSEKLMTNSKIEKTHHRLNILFADPTHGFIDHIKLGNENYKSVEREFQSNVGISPKLFKRIIQFNYASYMITHPKNHQSLTEIGYRAGYYDQAHFINSFKKFTFLPPKEYKKINDPMFTVNQEVINRQFGKVGLFT